MTTPFSAIFLDRDGTVNVEASYLSNPDDLVLLPGAAEAIARWNAAGVPVYIFTNQSGIGRGYLTTDQLGLVNARMAESLIAEGNAQVQGIYFCPHVDEDACSCRKPLPGQLLQASSEHEIDLSRVLVVGDMPRDLLAGVAVHAKTALVLTGHTKSFKDGDFGDLQPDYVEPDLLTLTNKLLDPAQPS